MTVSVTKEFTFDAAHRLPLHDGKCKNLHGHTYRVQVTVVGDVREDDGQPDYGMVVDFGVLTDIWEKRLKPHLDHQTLLWRGDHGIVLDGVNGLSVLEIYPTAENLALHILGMFRVWYGDVTAVRVYETPTSWADAHA